MSSNSDISGNKISHVKTLVLDAGPLITQTASSLQTYAQGFFTTPGVHNELKDEFAQSQLVLWGDNLKIRQPKSEFIKKVSEFAKLTGDYGVLSLNDIHIIALAYELEVEQNKGDWRLRKYPGEKKVRRDVKEEKTSETQDDKKSEDTKDNNSETKDEYSTESQASEELVKNTNDQADEWVVPNKAKESSLSTEVETKKKPRRRGGLKQRAKREAAAQKAEEEVAQLNKEQEITEDYEEDDDDGEWITPENLHEEMLKNANEKISEVDTSSTFIKVALATGDFACQNVALQIGLNLMNAMSGKRIKRVRNYMLRCHACFRLTPLPKDGTPKHFCSHCGGATLLRCAVSVDSKTGEITPHLKKNFEWHRRGDKYSLASPLSKNSSKKNGNAGYQHNPSKRQEVVLLNEDQKEYQILIKNEQWQRRQNEKLLEEWIGGGSADNYISPFNSVQKGHSAVKVGRSKFINSSKRK